MHNISRHARWLALVVIAGVFALALAPLTLGSSAAAAGNTYYVSPSGADGNAGTLDAPFRTLKVAFSRLKPGDTLYVRGGTYEERVTNPSIAEGTSSAPIRVQNFNGERPVIQGLLWLKNASYWQVSGINVTWSSANSSTEHMVKFSGGVGWTFSNAEVWGARSYAGLLVSGGATGWRVAYIYLHDTYRSNDDNQDQLMYVSDGSNGVIEYSLFVNAENGRGIKLARPASGDALPSNVIVRYNTFVNNAGANVSTSYDAHDNQIYGNIMVGPGQYQNVTALNLIPNANTVVRDNIGWASPQGTVVEPNANLTDGGNNQVLDPRLDAQFRPTNPALLGSNGTPFYGHLAGGAPPPAPATPTPTTPTPTPTTPTPTTPTPTPSPSPQVGATLVNDSFDTSALNRAPNGWFDTRQLANGTLTVASVGTGRALRASVTKPTGDVRPAKPFEVVTGGKLIVQADVLLDQMPKASGVYVGSLMSGGEFASAVWMGKSGTFGYFNGEQGVDTGVAYKANTWYRFTMVVDVSSRTYNVRIVRLSDRRILVNAANLTFRSPLATSVDRIRFDTSDGDVGLDMYIDNVKVTRA